MKWMKPLTIVGRVTLTVFVLEGVVAVSLQRLFQIFWPTWNSTIGFTILFGLINLAVWALIILGWYFVKFAGSIEWTSTKLIAAISGQRSSKLDKIQSESVEETELTKDQKTNEGKKEQTAK